MEQEENYDVELYRILFHLQYSLLPFGRGSHNEKGWEPLFYTFTHILNPRILAKHNDVYTCHYITLFRHVYETQCQQVSCHWVCQKPPFNICFY